MYEHELKRAVLGAKWSISSVPITTLAELLFRCRENELRGLKVDRILPIPQHWRQRVTRHFNPAWLLACSLARRLDRPCDVHVLRRVRRCRPQKRVAVQRRFENQRNSFALRDAHVVDGETILLVDDVLTTGATCSEAARLLKQAGAKHVHVAALARVLDHSA
jgi:ComF family protein